jgi:hypothetical protein
MIVADFRGGLEIGALLPPVTRAIFISFALALVPACCSESALLEFTAKGRALITKTFREHAAAMEEAAGVLSKQERLILLRLLKKLGTGGKDES